MEKLALSIREAAEALGLHQNTIYKMVEAGQLPATRIDTTGRGKGKLLISRQALEALLRGEVA